MLKRMQDGSLSADPLGGERHPPTGISAGSKILTLFILLFLIIYWAFAFLENKLDSIGSTIIILYPVGMSY